MEHETFWKWTEDGQITGNGWDCLKMGNFPFPFYGNFWQNGNGMGSVFRKWGKSGNKERERKWNEDDHKRGAAAAAAAAAGTGEKPTNAL